MLTATQIKRYARQIELPQIGMAGQMRLADSRILVIGAGGLGAPACLYLVGAGVGRLGIIDGDRISLSNLQRQVVYLESDLDRYKATTARRHLQQRNSLVEIDAMPFALSGSNAEAIIGRFDFILDATDSPSTKLLIADVCQRLTKPYVHAGVVGIAGQVMTVIPGKTACYACVFGDMGSEECNRGMTAAGPVGPLPGVLGALQALEAIKYCVGSGDLLTDRVLTVDVWTHRYRTIPVQRRADCTICGHHPTNHH